MEGYKRLCLDILKEIKKRRVKDQSSLNSLKIELLRKHKNIRKIPTNIEIANLASEKERNKYKELLTIKPGRSLSGVSVIAVMTKPFKCPHVKKGVGPCIMCPGGLDSYFGSVPQSYTGKEPATRRAIRNRYDSYLQVMNRLEQYIAMNKVPEKIELIIMGGTFPSYPKKYQEDFVKYCFKAMNDFGRLFFNNGNLNIKKFLNFFELPGDIGDKNRTKIIHNKLLLIKDLDLDNGRIVNNKLLNKKIIIKKSLNNKNNVDDYNLIKNDKNNAFSFLKCRKMQKHFWHPRNLRFLWKEKARQKEKNIVLEKEQVINETAKVRCVALCIETRPDYCTKKEINEMLKLGCTRVELGIQTIYDDVLEKIKRGHNVEDSIKATQLLKDSFLKVGYHVMPGLPGVSYGQDLRALKELIDNPLFRPDALKIYPCMVLRGTKLYDLFRIKKYKPLKTRQAANLIVDFKGYIPKYVRVMRVQRDIPTFVTEAGVDKTNLRQYVEKLMKEKKIKCNCIRCREPKDRKIDFKNVKLKRIDYEASNGKEIFLCYEENDILIGFLRLRIPFRKEISGNAVGIRELHVYGEALSIGRKDKKSLQHKGFGKKLIKEAEKIAKNEFKIKKIIVISGIGVKEYYSHLGYKKEGAYMVKGV